MKSAAPQFVVETISPALAHQYLGQNKRNRPKKMATVRNYADVIRRGQWLFNGEAIKFDWNDELVDGQHRLHAIVMADTPIETLVIRGLDPEAFKTIDTGLVRAGGDVLALRGVLYHQVMSSAYRSLYRWLGRGRSKQRISNTELLNLADDHPDLITLGYECMKKPYDARAISPVHRVFWFYLASHVDAGLARTFLESCGHQSTRGLKNAIALRERIVSTSREAIVPSARVKWIWLLQAWNAAVAGTDVPHLSRLPSVVDFKPRPKLT